MKQPPLITPDKVDVALAERRTLANGIDLYTLASDDFEVLRVTFVFGAGTSRQQYPFSASATANLLTEGSTSMTAQQIAEQLDYYGSYYDVSIDRDYAYISFCMLSKFFEPTLEVAAEILLRPAFSEEEVTTYRAKRLQELTIERTKVDIRAREAFASALFGAEHPYGRIYPADKYLDLTREHLTAFYASHYTAENCFVVCSGRIAESELNAISRLAEALPRAVAPVSAAFPTPTPSRSAYVPFPNAVQSSLRIGRLLFPRQHPDFAGMQVVAMLLGGYFSSRLMRTLREERGYTYGVMSAVINFKHEGYLAIATQVATEVTQEALDLIYAEIARLRTERVSDEELALVKNIMAGETMRILDGPFGIADVTIENILCDTDNRIIGENLQRIRAITPDEILALAQRYLRQEDLVTVVAGAHEPANH